MQEIYQRLKEFIDSQHLSVSAFEKKIGVSNDTLGKSFRDNKIFKIDVLSKIIEIYPDIDLNYIFKGAKENFALSEPSEGYGEKDKKIKALEEELLELYRKMNKG